MKNKQLVILTLLLSGISLTRISAQEAIPAADGNASGSGGSVSYTIGQVAYTFHTGSPGSVAQGIQQSFEISVVTELAEAGGIGLICSVFPVPAKNYVILKTENYNTADMWYQLYDESGRLLINNRVQGTETSVDMSHLVIATYVLSVRINNKIVKTFKIIKY